MDARRGLTWAGAAVVFATALLTTLTVPAGAAPSPDTLNPPLRVSADLDTASAAIPTAQNPSVTDRASSVALVRRPDAKGVASATATSDCDGCDGRSTVFQVVYFPGTGAAAADNTATAWSSCASCSSSAVSVQLVILRKPSTITVNNRALALNVVCQDCTTTSAAIQYVISGPIPRDISPGIRQRIADIEAQLADRLPRGDGSDMRRLKESSTDVVDEAAQQLDEVLHSELGDAVSVQRSVDVQVGS